MPESCTCNDHFANIPNQPLNICPVHQPRLYKLWMESRHG